MVFGKNWLGFWQKLAFAKLACFWPKLAVGMALAKKRGVRLVELTGLLLQLTENWQKLAKLANLAKQAKLAKTG